MTSSPRTAFSRQKRLTLTLTGTALAAAALLTAGCGPNSASGGSGGSGSGGSGSAQAAVGSGSTAPTSPPSSVGATAPPSGNTGATAAPATAAGSGGAAPGTPGTAKSDCTGDDLKVTVGNGEGAAGSTIVPVVFTNKSGGPCGIQGFPGVSLGNSGGQIGAAATRDSSQSSPLITIPAGGKVNAQLKVADAQNYPSGTCKPTKSSFLQVYPPNQTDSVDVPFKTSGCQNKSVKLLQVQPVVRGAGG